MIDEAVLKRAFKAEYGILITDMAQDLEKLKALPKDKSYVTMDDRGCYVRGRFYWATGGKQSSIAHGGLLFMECMAPSIQLRK